MSLKFTVAVQEKQVNMLKMPASYRRYLTERERNLVKQGSIQISKEFVDQSDLKKYKRLQYIVKDQTQESTYRSSTFNEKFENKDYRQETGSVILAKSQGAYKLIFLSQKLDAFIDTKQNDMKKKHEQFEKKLDARRRQNEFEYNEQMQKPSMIFSSEDEEEQDEQQLKTSKKKQIRKLKKNLVQFIYYNLHKIQHQLKYSDVESEDSFEIKKKRKIDEESSISEQIAEV